MTYYSNLGSITVSLIGIFGENSLNDCGDEIKLLVSEIPYND